MRRIPGVPPLTRFLPVGTEGGKEFARIVDKLLFRESRRNNKTFMCFSDAAGDFHGLDSFVGNKNSNDGVTGFQYKYYPSPLTSGHRSEIKAALLKANEQRNETGLKRWVLITPEDLTNSAVRSDRGDVAWFDSLKKDLNLDVEIEHWGHSVLVELMLQSPHICLFYYPELVPDISHNRKSLQEIKASYDRSLLTRHGKIQFIGMSVRKEEAAKGIPMDQIYIPLSLIPWGPKGVKNDKARRNPLELLSIGARSVVLGDPGSGKSTLARFLSLVGQHQGLQQRVGASPDDRLCIHVTLRRYSDELNTNHNSSLLDYIVAQARADLSSPDADAVFFQSYLETGKSIVLFDGLDEVHENHKEVIRDRIMSFMANFPGNSTVVTSRIVGYDDIRFDHEELTHVQVGSLELPEIAQFVMDWYLARIDDERERTENVDDLIRLIEEPTHTAIRELAQNPLLLAIIALVHRVDATLPDERVILYEKCTETLLNTWNNRKFGKGESRSLAKQLDKEYHSRMEAIGYWMQKASATPGQRAVVPYSDLREFLGDYIRRFNRRKDNEADPEFVAEEFLDFIEQRAGLLIEVGHREYSFIHLTFQEYLAARYLISQAQKVGVATLWNTLAEYLEDARWHEVVRLLAASFSYDAQEDLIFRMLDHYRTKSILETLKSLGGCLLDGVKAAEDEAESILSHILDRALNPQSKDEYLWVVNTMRGWLARSPANKGVLVSVMLPRMHDKKVGLDSVLLGITLGWTLEDIEQFFDLKELGEHVASCLQVLFSGKAIQQPELLDKLNDLIPLRNLMLRRSATMNIAASVLTLVLAAINPDQGPHYLISASFSTYQTAVPGPFEDWHIHAYQFCGGVKDLWIYSRLSRRDKDYRNPAYVDTLRGHINASGRGDLLDSQIDDTIELMEVKLRGRSISEVNTWAKAVSVPSVSEAVISLLCGALSLPVTLDWSFAIQAGLLDKIGDRLHMYGPEGATRLHTQLSRGERPTNWEYLGSWFVLQDLWLDAMGPGTSEYHSTDLVDFATDIDHPTLSLVTAVAHGREPVKAYMDPNLPPLFFTRKQFRKNKKASSN